jgi:hypothetical protein
VKDIGDGRSMIGDCTTIDHRLNDADEFAIEEHR